MTLQSGCCRFLPLLLLLLSGCAGTPQVDRLLADPPDTVGTGIELHQVPFFPQQAYQCGPAALATVLNWSGVSIEPEALTPQVYIPQRRGSLQVELLAATRRSDRIPYILRPRLEDVLRELQAGNPVLVLQNLGLSWYPSWHYAVLVGFDLAAQQLVLRSGAERRHLVSMRVFERTWARGGRWAVVVTRPTVIPVTAEQTAYLQAIASLTLEGQETVTLAAYQAALRRWPGSKGAQMGVGNSLYVMGALADAAQVFAKLVQHYPEYAPAHNNLAQIYLEQGKLHQAQRLARKAVQLGGRHLPTYRKTLRDIDQALRNSRREGIR